MAWIIGAELEFFRKCKNAFFNDAFDRSAVLSIFSTERDWKYSSYLAIMSKNTRIVSSLRELKNHSTTAPSQGVQPLIPGMNKSLYKSTGFVKARSSSTQHHSCSVHDVSKISELITGRTVIL